MTQALWYLRHDNKVIGPFPAPQIKDLLDIGEVAPDWEISLNERDWLTIQESGQFASEHSDRAKAHAEEQQAWLAERERARKRWIQSDGDADAPVAHDPSQDEMTRQAVAQDHDKTETLIHSELAHRTSPLMAVLALLALALIGLLVWWGQQDNPIQTGISLAANCGKPLADGVNWTGCDKRSIDFSNGRAHNARMERVCLDDAKLLQTNLEYVTLRKASLRNADLRGAVLLGADLSGADLSGANLTGADLRYAILQGAIVVGTRFDGAHLDKAVWPDGRVCREGATGQCQ